jgi:hypothetical protein
MSAARAIEFARALASGASTEEALMAFDSTVESGA